WFERASHRIVPIVQSAINLIAPDDQLGGARSETFYTFRNPKLDGRERRFVGFLTVEKRDGVPHPALKSPATITRVHRFSGDPMVGRDGGLRFFGSGLDPPAPADLTWHD